MNYTDLKAFADDLINTDDTKYPVARKTRSANRAMERINYLILSVSNLVDDTNNTDYPEQTFNLVSGQRDYAFSTETNGYQVLKIHKVFVKESGENFQELTYRDYLEADYADEASDDGTPMYWSRLANGIILDPAPDYSLSDGGKVIFEREFQQFTTADTTKEPGFHSPFHHLVAFYMAHDYAIAKNMEQKVDLRNQIEKMEAELKDYYSVIDPGNESLTVEVTYGE